MSAAIPVRPLDDGQAETILALARLDPTTSRRHVLERAGAIVTDCLTCHEAYRIEDGRGIVGVSHGYCPGSCSDSAAAGFRAELGL